VNSSRFDLLVIGSGPAGLFTAINAAKPGRHIGIIEKNGSAGVKLLLTGGGKCNLTHAGTREDFLRHYGGAAKARFVKPSLYGFPHLDLMRFFEQRGVSITLSDDGKAFPATMKSRDILRCLMDECARHGIEIRYGEPVTSVNRTPSGFIVSSTIGRYESRTLVIATGGASYPQTGSTGDGYLMAKSLGHSIVPPAPALSPVIISEFRFSGCAGISLYGASIALTRNGKKMYASIGDVLFTHCGFSGPGILDMSRYIEPGDTLLVSLLPANDADTFAARFTDDLTRSHRKSLRRCLKVYGIPARLVDTAADAAGINLDQHCSAVTKSTRQGIINFVVQNAFRIERVEGFDKAMVSRGGVALREVVPATMQSRLVPGLFFAGEILNIDGDTGGYNLQFAFSSGWMVGKKAA
jgi:predicted Rossmann fold flavoprotein